MQKFLWCRSDGEACREGYLLEGLFPEEIWPIYLFFSHLLQYPKNENVDFSKGGYAAKEQAKPQWTNFAHPTCYAAGNTVAE